MIGAVIQIAGRHLGRQVMSTGVTIVKGAAITWGTQRLVSELEKHATRKTSH